MIGKITGTLIEKSDSHLLVSVSGISYTIATIPSVTQSCELGTPCSLWTHLIVSETALSLYGFTDKETLHFFKLLIGISGVGPKSALGILALAPPSVLAKAIVTENTAYLTKVSGIGRKSAEKIVLELRDKLKGASLDEEGNDLHDDTDAVLALRSLGYSREEAREALAKVSGEVAGTEGRIKEALKYLSR
jgi:Holliday junction DNA helicase RuvA